MTQAETLDHRVLRITRKDGSEHFVLYDVADAELIESRTWHIKPCSWVAGQFYALTKFTRPDGRRAQLAMHVLLAGRRGVDHINHNGLDNRRSNLRLATPSQNAANQRPVKGAASRYKGVVWYKRERRWVARICFEGVQRHLGYFDDEAAAAEAYDRAARRLFGEFAFLNLPTTGETRG